MARSFPCSVSFSCACSFFLVCFFVDPRLARAECMRAYMMFKHSAPCSLADAGLPAPAPAADFTSDPDYEEARKLGAGIGLDDELLADTIAGFAGDVGATLAYLRKQCGGSPAKEPTPIAVQPEPAAPVPLSASRGSSPAASADEQASAASTATMRATVSAPVNKATKCAWLAMEVGALRKTWQKRWFVLDGKRLLVYKSGGTMGGEGEPIVDVDTESCALREPKSIRKGHEHSFRIDTTGKVKLVVDALTEMEKAAWFGELGCAGASVPSEWDDFVMMAQMKKKNYAELINAAAVGTSNKKKGWLNRKQDGAKHLLHEWKPFWVEHWAPKNRVYRLAFPGKRNM